MRSLVMSAISAAAAFSATALHAEPLKIGIVESLSGAQTSTGRLYANAVKYGVDRINDTGGFNGEPVTVTPIPTDTTTGGSVADLGDDRIGHQFDQTNGLVDTTGESDETREGETLSAGERRADQRRSDGGLPPVSGNLGQH